MNMRKIVAVLQCAGKYFMHAAGLVGLVFTILAAVIFVPPVITLPVAGGIGLIWAMVGGKKGLNQINQEEEKEKETKKAFGTIAHLKKDLRELTEEVRDDFEELKEEIGSSNQPDDEEPLISKRVALTSNDSSDSDSDNAKKPPKDSPMTVVSRLAHKQQKDLNHVFRLFKRKKKQADNKQQPAANVPLDPHQSIVRIHLG